MGATDPDNGIWICPHCDWTNLIALASRCTNPTCGLPMPYMFPEMRYEDPVKQATKKPRNQTPLGKERERSDETEGQQSNEVPPQTQTRKHEKVHRETEQKLGGDQTPRMRKEQQVKELLTHLEEMTSQDEIKSQVVALLKDACLAKSSSTDKQQQILEVLKAAYEDDFQRNPVRNTGRAREDRDDEREDLSSLSISLEQRKNYLDDYKHTVERITGEKWNWWPLEPAMEPLEDDEVVLTWKCVSIMC
jgi:hypothetical protein